MAHEIAAGTIFIKEGAALPDGLHFAKEKGIAGWDTVTDLDCAGIAREIEKTGWRLFSIAGGVRTTVFGMDLHKMLRKAVDKILHRGRAEGFNALEILQVDDAGSLRFPLVLSRTVRAQWRDIQRGVISSHANAHSQLSEPSKARNQRADFLKEHAAIG